MAVTATPVLPQNPKIWTASINNGDASAWKALRDSATAAGAGTNGAKITSITATSTDSSARDVQLAIVRAIACTVTSASPGVVTISTGSNISNGDQIFFQGTAVPTGLTAGTTYFVVSATPSTQTGVSATFSVSATFGGTAINTSSTGTTVIAYIIRTNTTASLAATAGTVSTVPSTNFLSSTYWVGAPVDNDGNTYIFLESGDYLAVSAVATITAAKILTFTAFGANF